MNFSKIIQASDPENTNFIFNFSETTLNEQFFESDYFSPDSTFPPLEAWLPSFSSTTQPFLTNSSQNDSSTLDLLGISNNTYDSTTNYSSTTLESDLPSELVHMSLQSRNEVIAYSILFLIAASGNLTVFFTVSNQLAKLKWRITVLMLHLSIADLIVTFFLMPLEICWRLTIGWVAGEMLCKVCLFLRAFGLYLSSNILICISLDRFMAILYPLRMVGATKRVKIMIGIAWISAAAFAAPQLFVFSVQSHPRYPSFKQCVSFGFFSTPTRAALYSIFSVSILYFVPLFFIIFTYTMILWKISSKSTEHLKHHNSSRKEVNNSTTITTAGSTINGGGHKRSSRTGRKCHVGNSESANLLARAKKRTLRMTFVIVIVFVFCWTPYTVITLWYMIDQEGARSIHPSIQACLFMMAVANSCLNPIVYGSYTKKTTAGPYCPRQCSCFSFRCIASPRNNAPRGTGTRTIGRPQRFSLQDQYKKQIGAESAQQTSTFLVPHSII